MKNYAQIFINIILSFLGLLTFYPVFLMLVSSFKYDIQILDNFWFFSLPMQFDNYSKAFMQVYPFIINSLIVTAGVTALSLLISTMAGYSFSRFDFPGRDFLFYMILILMMVPGFMTLVPQFVISRNLHILDSYAVQILPLSGYVSILSLFLIKTYIEGLPNSLFDMARIEGAGDYRILWYIVIPLCMPVLSVVAIINSVAAWNNYIWPLVSANKASVRPLIIGITNITGKTHELLGIKFAAYVIASFPLLFMFIFTNKAFVAGVTGGAVKG